MKIRNDDDDQKFRLCHCIKGNSQDGEFSRGEGLGKGYSIFGIRVIRGYMGFGALCEVCIRLLQGPLLTTPSCSCPTQCKFGMVEPENLARWFLYKNPA